MSSQLIYKNIYCSITLSVYLPQIQETLSVLLKIKLLILLACLNSNGTQFQTWQKL